MTPRVPAYTIGENEQMSMLFTKILWGSSALYDGISSRKMPQACVRSEEFREKVRLLFATKVGVKVTLSFCQPVGTQQISWM